MSNSSTTSGMARLPFPGDVIDERYRLGAVVASGGMGVVMKADQLRTGRQVAMKLLHPHVVSDPEFKTRFRREAEVATLFDHNSIVRVYDVGETEDGVLFLVMELLDGEELDDVIKRESPLKMGRVLDMSLQMLDGLAEAHNEGVVHRDIKPANVFVCRNRRGEDDVKLLDFGVAKLVNSSSTQITATGSITGTPSYIAPESMFRDEDNNWKAADIYAAGLVILEMMTGQRSFDGAAMAQTMLQHLKEPVVIPSAIADTPLAEVVIKATAKHPDDRFEDADEMYLALRDCMEAVDRDLVVFGFDREVSVRASSSQISQAGIYNSEGADLSVLRDLPQHVVEGSGEPIGPFRGAASGGPGVGDSTLPAYDIDDLKKEDQERREETASTPPEMPQSPVGDSGPATRQLTPPRETIRPSRESTDVVDGAIAHRFGERSTLYLALGGLAVVLLGGALAYVALSGQDSDGEEVPEEEMVAAVPIQDESGEESAEARSADEGDEKDDEAEVSGHDEQGVIIDSEPPGATVMSGDEEIGTSPLEIDRTKWTEVYPLVLELEGHQAIELEEFPEEEWLVIALEAEEGEEEREEPQPTPEPTPQPDPVAQQPDSSSTAGEDREPDEAEDDQGGGPDIDGMIDEHLFD